MKKKPSHFMTTVKIGPKGQVVIPKEIRDMFSLEPGDSLVIMADEKRGIALQKQNVLLDLANKIFGGESVPTEPETTEEGLSCFANAIKETSEKGESSR